MYGIQSNNAPLPQIHTQRWRVDDNPSRRQSIWPYTPFEQTLGPRICTGGRVCPGVIIFALRWRPAPAHLRFTPHLDDLDFAKAQALKEGDAGGVGCADTGDEVTGSNWEAVDGVCEAGKSAQCRVVARQRIGKI